MRKLGKAQDVADRTGQQLDAVWRSTREGLYPFAVRVSQNRYRYDLDGLEEFIKNGGIEKNSTSESARTLRTEDGQHAQVGQRGNRRRNRGGNHETK